MQQDDGGPLATHFVPGGQARDLNVTGLEAFQGRRVALGHRSLLPDEDRKAPLGSRPSKLGATRRCAMTIALRAAPCRDESRDRAGANRPPEPFINGLVLTLKGLTLAR